MKTIPVAVQMFTLRNEAEQDFTSTLRRVAEIGYDGVEFAGYGGLQVEQVKELLDELGLKAAASHVPLDQLENNLDKVIEEQKILGSQYIVCPFLMPDRRSEADYEQLISFLEKAGATCKEQGLSLCYHNHDFELAMLSDGRTALQSIFDDTSAEHLQTELDVYWLTKAGENPVEWINRYKHRTPLVHLKDMTKDDDQFFAELGTGGVNLEGVMEAAAESGASWFVVEQDVSRLTPFESIEISINYLNKQLSR